MRVLFCCRPTYGHFYPLVPLAQACGEAGHDVVFATGSELAPRVEAIGFAAVPAGPPIMWAFGRLLAHSLTDDLVPVIQRLRPELVIFETADVGAPVAAGVVGVPAVHHSIGRVSFPWMTAIADQLAPVWAKWGCDPPAPLAGLAGQAYLDICPPGLQDPSAARLHHVIRMRPVAWAEPGDVPGWVRQRRVQPLVYVTLGTIACAAVDVLRTVVDAVSSLGVEVLVAVGPQGDPAALGKRPARLHVERFLPNPELLPHVDAVVHHCGGGTMFAASAVGLPQLGLPRGADQFVNAEGLAASGAGVFLLPDEITADAVAAAVGTILDDDATRNAAARLAMEIAAMPAPADVVAELRALVHAVPGS